MHSGNAITVTNNPHFLHCLFTALSDSRTSEEKAKIVDEFFERYEKEVAKRPEDHGMDYVHAYMVIRKN